MHLLPNKCSTSPDQIGRFFKVLGDKNSNKSRSYDWQLLGNVEKPHSYVNAAVAILFGQLVQTFGLSFTPPPGHHLVTLSTTFLTTRPGSHLWDLVVTVFLAFFWLAASLWGNFHFFNIQVERFFCTEHCRLSLDVRRSKKFKNDAEPN